MAKILVIDDMDAIRESINMILSADGHHIEEAKDGQEGLGMIDTGDYDLVITDILMPEKDGTEVLMKLRNIGSDIPVIAMSGGGNLVSEEYTLEIAENYANAILKKPFSREKLQSVISELLKEDVA